MPLTSGFNHVATLTADLERLVGFYSAAFGAEVIFEMAASDDHPHMVILGLGGGAALNVFEVTAEEIIGERRRQGGRGAIDHFALAVPTLQALEDVGERIVAAGGEIGEIQRLGDDGPRSELRLRSDLTARSGPARWLGTLAPPLAARGHDWVLDNGIRQFRAATGV